MAIDKILLRQAICDGAFSNRPIGLGPVSPEILTAVAGMDDTAIQTVLTSYAEKKKVQLAARLAVLQKQVADTQDVIDRLG